MSTAECSSSGLSDERCRHGERCHERAAKHISCDVCDPDSIHRVPGNRQASDEGALPGNNRWQRATISPELDVRSRRFPHKHLQGPGTFIPSEPYGQSAVRRCRQHEGIAVVTARYADFFTDVSHSWRRRASHGESLNRWGDWGSLATPVDQGHETKDGSDMTHHMPPCDRQRIHTFSACINVLPRQSEHTGGLRYLRTGSALGQKRPVEIGRPLKNALTD